MKQKLPTVITQFPRFQFRLGKSEEPNKELLLHPNVLSTTFTSYRNDEIHAMMFQKFAGAVLGLLAYLFCVSSQ